MTNCARFIVDGILVSNESKWGLDLNPASNAFMKVNCFGKRVNHWSTRRLVESLLLATKKLKNLISAKRLASGRIARTDSFAGMTRLVTNAALSEHETSSRRDVTSNSKVKALCNLDLGFPKSFLSFQTAKYFLGPVDPRAVEPEPKRFWTDSVGPKKF